MMRIRWTKPAFNDLQHISSYISQDNPAAAKNVLTLIRNSSKNLAQYPEMGRIGRIERTKEFIVPGTSYLIVYRIKDEILEILRILHSAQKWPKSFST